jgi:hypothetical protein
MNISDFLRSTARTFGALSDDEIENALLPTIYEFAHQRLGERRAQRVFRKLGSRKYAIDNAATTLLFGYILEGQRNKSEFLRKRAAYNKTLPPSQQRGAGSADVDSLRRYLDRALKEHRAFLARPDIALMYGNPDFADEVMQAAKRYKDQRMGQISEKTS